MFWAKGMVLLESFKIFDRWGAVVFEEENKMINDLDSGWDGRVNGLDLHAGVYVYLVEITFLDGFVKFYAGDVTLLR